MVLGEYVDHHIKEERNEMFAKVRKTLLDLVKLREQLQERKEALMGEMQSDSSALRELSTAL